MKLYGRVTDFEGGPLAGAGVRVQGRGFARDVAVASTDAEGRYELDLAGGTHNLATGSTVSGTGDVTISGGTVNVAGSYSVTGDTNIAGGQIGHPASYFWPYGDAGASHRVPGLAERGGRTGDYLTDQLTDEALKFMAANRDRPFYLQLWHYTVHAPLMAKKELVRKYEQIPGSNGQSNAVYAAMIESMDESVGRILDILEQMNLADHTIVVFTSDMQIAGIIRGYSPPEPFVAWIEKLMRIGRKKRRG